MSADVAYQGVPAAFGHDAALAFAGEAASCLACRRFEDVFQAVADGAAPLGVVPIENTLAGSVHETYDALARFHPRGVRIVGERVLRIAHALIAPHGVSLRDVRRVFSHPVALAQCEGLFRAHPEFEAVAAFNTAGAVQQVIASGARDTAAIASVRAARAYDGEVLLDEIEDHAENYTRFLAISRTDHALPTAPAAPTAPTATSATSATPLERWKTSILFTLEHRPGTLASLLAAFADRGIDLVKIESRPLPGRPFEYAFYVDLLGRVGDAAPGQLDEALLAAGQFARTLWSLGSYPAAKAPERATSG
jgi:prephenate dehydratase